MTCATTQHFLLDETAPRPADLDAHLATCADCRDLQRAHATALHLRGLAPSTPTRIRRDLVQRRAGITFGLLLAVGAGAGLVQLRAPREAPVTVNEGPVPPRPEGELPVVDVDAEWRALVGLHAAVAQSAHADPTREDRTYRRFGALPAWLAPQTTRPLHALGRTLSPVVQTPEN
jgi:hypothetical protein